MINLLLIALLAEPWITLFDGETMNGWRGFGRDDVPKGWTVEDGAIHFTPGIEGGDIITVDKFCDFELEVEWRISKNGNSGIFFRSTEDYGVPWQTAPEYQILDNTGHWDGKSEYTSAGSNYALHKPAMDMTKPVGEWNQAKIIAKGNHVEHWMNGMKIVEYELHSESWNKLVSESKFNSMADYGKRDCGHIDFQDHGDNVWYRNIRIRPIIDQHAGTNPIPQEDEWAQSWWPLRHIKKLEYIQANSDRELVFMGDSITQGWEYPGINKIWEKTFSKYKPYNIGFSGDRTEHLLWRIQNGEMQNINPKLSVIMIGTNNSHGGHNAKIIRDGIEKIVRTLRDMLPDMKILILGIFPCGENAEDTKYNQWIPKGTNPRKVNEETNAQILKLADGKMVHYLDIGKNFMEDDGLTISAEIMPDFLHLSEKGYQIWADSITEKIEELMNN